ncbi:MAG: hypothetical protein ACI8UD_003056, partial [Planctomycetota bacterium]
MAGPRLAEAAHRRADQALALPFVARPLLAFTGFADVLAGALAATFLGCGLVVSFVG